MQAAFVNIGTEKNSFIHVKDVIPQVDEKVAQKVIPEIKEVIKPKQKILVQIQKDSNEIPIHLFANQLSLHPRKLVGLQKRF